MKSFFQLCFFFLDKKSKSSLPALLGLFLLSSLLDVIGIGMIGVFLVFIVNVDMLAYHLPVAIQPWFHAVSQTKLIVAVGLCVIFAFSLKCFLGIYAQRYLVSFTTSLSVRKKIQLLEKYQLASYLFHLKNNVASMANQMSLIDSVTNLVSTLLMLLSSGLIIIGVLAVLLIVHPVVTCLLVAMFMLIFFAHSKFVKHRVREAGILLSTANAKINKPLLEAMGGLVEIRVLGREKHFLDAIRNSAYEIAKARANVQAFQIIPRYSIESCSAIFLVTIVLFAILGGKNPVDIMPSLGVFAAACLRLLPTVTQVISGISTVQVNLPSLELHNKEFYELEKYFEKTLCGSSDDDRTQFQQISLREVQLKYPCSMKPALESISLDLCKGESIGLIGATGAGKSTLASVILGLLTPTSGEITVDGKLVNSKRHWMNNFAYIPQQIFLLDDSLKHNIALGEDDDEIDSQKMQQAMTMAQLDSVVEGLSEGIDTVLGQNGVRLSGGQRQRVALARALYHERDIIVMDEATSALDNETEQEIINSIRRLHGFKTLIVIAHRLSTIKYCDRVYRLDSGKIVESGSYQEVVEMKVEDKAC